MTVRFKSLHYTNFYSKTNEMHHFLKFILFCSSTLHVSDGLSVHHQESKTVHTAYSIRYMSYRCYWLLASGNEMDFTFVVALYMFRAVFPSIIRSLRLYIQRTASGICHTDAADCLLAATRWILFCSGTLHVSNGLSLHHQESKTVHTASGNMSNRFC